MLADHYAPAAAAAADAGGDSLASVDPADGGQRPVVYCVPSRCDSGWLTGGLDEYTALCWLALLIPGRVG